MAAIRSALAAVAEAEAVTADHSARSAGVTSQHVAGSIAGLGAGDVPRRELTERDVREVVSAEVAGRRAQARGYDELGEADAAERLRREADVLESFVVS
jgi:hypothetical protein